MDSKPSIHFRNKSSYLDSSSINNSNGGDSNFKSIMSPVTQKGKDYYRSANSNSLVLNSKVANKKNKRKKFDNESVGSPSATINNRGSKKTLNDLKR